MPRSLSYDISSRYRDVQAYPSTGEFGLSFVNPAVPPLVFPAAPFDYGTGVLDVGTDAGCGIWRLQIPACSFVGIPGIYEGTFVSLAQACLNPVAWGQVLRAMQAEGGAGVLLVRPQAAATGTAAQEGCGPTPVSGPVSYALRRGLPRATGTVTDAPFDGAVPVTPFPAWLGTQAVPAATGDPCPCRRDRRPGCACSGRPAYRVMLYPNFCNNPLNTGTGAVYTLVGWNAATSTFVLDPPLAQPPVQPGCWSSWSWELWEQVGGAAATKSSFTGPKRWQCGSGTGIGTVRLRDIYVPCSARLADGGYICDLPYIYVQLWPEHGNQCNESFGSFAPIETTQRLTYKVGVNAPGPRVKLWQQLPAGYDSPTASSPQPWTFLHVWVLGPEGRPLQFEPLMPNAYPEAGPDRYSQVMLTIDATWLD